MHLGGLGILEGPVPLEVHQDPVRLVFPVRLYQLALEGLELLDFLEVPGDLEHRILEGPEDLELPEPLDCPDYLVPPVFPEHLDCPEYLVPPVFPEHLGCPGFLDFLVHLADPEDQPVCTSPVAH